MSNSKVNIFLDTAAHALGHALRFNSEIVPKRVACTGQEDDITFGQLGDAVHRIYGFFKYKEIGSQDRISFYLKDCWQHVAFSFATTISGSAVFERNKTVRKAFHDFGCTVAIVHEREFREILGKICNWQYLKMVIVIESKESSDLFDETIEGIRCVSMGSILHCPPLYDDYEDWNDRDAEEKLFYSTCPHTGRPKQITLSAQDLKNLCTPQYMYSCDYYNQVKILQIPSLSTPAGYFRIANAVAMGSTMVLGPFRTQCDMNRETA